MLGRGSSALAVILMVGRVSRWGLASIKLIWPNPGMRSPKVQLTIDVQWHLMLHYL